MTDLDSILPASITALFPRQDDGLASSDLYPVVVTLVSLAMPEFPGVVGFPGTRTLRVQITAVYVSGTLINGAALLAAAQAQARQWYLWQGLATEDRVLAGALPWQMEGLTDTVEWSHTDQGITTRLARGPYLTHVDAAPVSVIERTEEQLRCFLGVLFLFTRKVHIKFDGGRLSTTEGHWTFDSTQGCCDCSGLIPCCGTYDPGFTWGTNPFLCVSISGATGNLVPLNGTHQFQRSTSLQWWWWCNCFGGQNQFGMVAALLGDGCAMRLSFYQDGPNLGDLYAPLECNSGSGSTSGSSGGSGETVIGATFTGDITLPGGFGCFGHGTGLDETATITAVVTFSVDGSGCPNDNGLICDFGSGSGGSSGSGSGISGEIVPCCPSDGIPDTIFLTLSGPGLCPCMATHTVTLTYAGLDGSGNPTWTAIPGDTCSGDAIAWSLTCQIAFPSSNWILNLFCGGAAFGQSIPDSAGCNPFGMTGTLNIPGGEGNCCPGATISWTVTG